ncbi:TIGR02328 family protein [Aerococcaceae bacterium NML191292]|nr:TIGR02328 family protein [Aerococcaceae bacterium NML191292]
MRLWHEAMITHLPRQQLLGQHRECAALRGNGWGKPHATVNYVFQHSPYKLYQYHRLIMIEMKRRGYQPDARWEEAAYRGKSCAPHIGLAYVRLTTPIYPEHNDDYYQECVSNLARKGIAIDKHNRDGNGNKV